MVASLAFGFRNSNQVYQQLSLFFQPLTTGLLAPDLFGSKELKLVDVYLLFGIFDEA